MPKNLNISMLYDFYGDLLTEKQQEVIELYYNEDLSLAEIAAHSKITRQGVRDSIKRAETQLLEFESLLGLFERFGQIKTELEKIVESANEIARVNDRLYSSKEIARATEQIKNHAKQIAEQ